LIPNAIVQGFHQGFKAAAVFAVAGSIVALVVFKVHKVTNDDMDNEAETEAEALAAIPGA
jgi:hypothetical protein